MTNSEEDIRSVLSHEIKRIIARFCKTPHLSSEIVRHVMSRKRSSLLLVYEGIVSSGLRELEKLGAISYAEGKWKTTELAIKVLEKYFG